MRGSLRQDQLIITIAPGKTLSWLAEQLGEETAVIRTMPNTPAMVGEGITAACPNARVSEEQLALGLKLLESFGKAEVVPERLIDAVVAGSGSSPAYIFMLIEAMGDAAVAEGMPTGPGLHLCCSSGYGQRKRWSLRQKAPRELKDMVCSPAGTTIEAVQALGNPASGAA